jgi:hypothetical protein
MVGCLSMVVRWFGWNDGYVGSEINKSVEDVMVMGL